MKELLDQEGIVGDRWDEDTAERGLAKWLEVWFLLVGSIVNLVSLNDVHTK